MKLVRDNIPEIIRSNEGVAPEWRTVRDRAEHRELLLEKILEEYAEYTEADQYIQKIEELADLSEVLHSFAVSEDYDEQHLQFTQRKQRSFTELEGASGHVLDEHFTHLYTDLSETPSTSERLDKLAGLLSCVYGYSEDEGIPIDEVEHVRLKKREHRGSFIGGVVLLSSGSSDNPPKQ